MMPVLVPRLSPRQEQVAQLIGDGLEYKQIAGRLRISHGRVNQLVVRIAKIVGPPEHDPEMRLSPRDTVFLWENHRRWLARHFPPTPPLLTDVVPKHTDRISA